MIYSLFQHSAMNVALSSYVAILCTLIIMLTIIVVFFVEQGILSDIALISLFVIFLARSAFINMPIETAESSFQWTYFVSRTGIEISWNQIMTVDFWISSILALSTLLSFPLFVLDKEDLFAEEDDPTHFQENIFGFLLVMLYTHILLTASGHIITTGIYWRIFQSFFTLGFYCWRLRLTSGDEWLEHLKGD